MALFFLSALHRRGFFGFDILRSTVQVLAFDMELGLVWFWFGMGTLAGNGMDLGLDGWRHSSFWETNVCSCLVVRK